MKYAHLILILLLSTALTAQKVDIKKISIQTIDGTEYYVRADTAGGEITIHLVPVQDQVKLLAAQIVQIEAEIAQYDELLDQVDAKRRDARQRKKEVEKLQNQIQNKGKAAVDPTPINSPKKEAGQTPAKTPVPITPKKKKGGGR